MNRRRRLRAIVLSTAVAVVAGLLAVQPANAEVPPPYFATSTNGSDPHMIPCTDPSTGTNGFCLYTSRDMGQSFAYPPANYYPMEETRVYFSANGYSGWSDKGRAFHENTIQVSNDGWVPNNAYHLWAPSAAKSGSYYYLFVPDVSDTSDTGNPNIHTSSRIAVARSTSPFGPFSYRGTVTVHGYMSDPDVVIDGSNRVLIWANGDNSNCGGFSTAVLESDMLTTVSRSANPLTINGLGVLGNCGGTGRPYVEGASLYKTGTNMWVMYFAAKPTSTPAECATSVNGPGSANEVIAWATSSYAQGPYTYKGIVMCGNSDEWTNQATVQTVSNGRTIMVYHDSPANIKERKLHAECLFASSTVNGAPRIIGGVYRQALNAANGFDDCMAGTNAGYWGMHMVDPQYPNLPPIIRAPSNGTALTANRYAVGPWERYDLVQSGSHYLIRALSNGKYLCAKTETTPVAASCTSTSTSTAWWYIYGAPGGSVGWNLKNVSTGKYLSVAGNGSLYAGGTHYSHAAVVNALYPGGKSD